MKKHLPGFAMGVGVTALVAYLARPMDMNMDVDKRPSMRTPAADATGDSSQPPAPVDAAAPPSAQKAGAPAPSGVATSDGVPSNLPANSTPVPALELSGGRLIAQASGDSSSLDKLLNSTRVRCTFDRGGGGYWPSGKLFPHTAAWQGGPVDFESVDILGNRARLTGNAGVTGTLEGVTEIRVTATGSGLHFSGFKPDGELIATTVFGTLDSDGHYLAVMSTHGTGLNHESAQFYGGCTL